MNWPTAHANTKNFVHGFHRKFPVRTHRRDWLAFVPRISRLEDFGFEVDFARKAANLTQRLLVDTQNQLESMLEVMPIRLLIHTEQGLLFADREACRRPNLGVAMQSELPINSRHPPTFRAITRGMARMFCLSEKLR